jgi:succinylglutamate desuccinylase
MLALGKLLELTLAGREPAQQIQLTPAGVRLRWLGEGALEVTPPQAADQGLDLLISAGIHGNETAPIELLDEVVQALANSDWAPRARVLFLLGNPEAIRHGERYREQDINRLFNGRHTHAGGAEALRAAELERLAANFFAAPERRRLHYDMHTAIRGSTIEQFALYPWHPEREHSPRELARLARAGMSAVLLQSRSSITFSAYTYERLGAEAFTLELGKARPFGQNQSVDLGRLRSVLQQLICGTEPALEAGPPSTLQVFRVAREIIKHSDDFQLHLPADVQNFTELPVGYLLAEDRPDLRWIVEEPGARIIFPNPGVKNGLRAGLLIVPEN